MTARDPPKQDLAERLLQWERRPGAAAGSRPELLAALRVCEKLRLPLTRVMGVAGFRSIFSRALVLAAARAPCLRTLLVNPNGTLAGLDQVDAGQSAEDLALGEVALVAELLGLLETFIGPALTIGLLQDAWPDGDFSEFEGPT